MGFLQHYEEEGRKSLSVCFCLLDQMSSEDEDSLRAMQREFILIEDLDSSPGGLDDMFAAERLIDTGYLDFGNTA